MQKDLAKNVVVPFAYEDHLIRTVTLDNGEPGFVAADVAKVLEHSNVSMMIQGLDDDEYLTSKLFISGQNREVFILTEPGLYTVLIRSSKPQAKPFRRWVTHEVLPEIRKTGGYVQSDSALSLTASDREALKRIAIAHAGILAVLGITGNAAVLAVNQEIIKLTGGEINPLASSGNTYLIAEKQEQLFTATEIGKKVGLTAMKVNLRLCESGYQIMNGAKGNRFYELTEKGKVYGQYLDTGKRHGNGQPVRAVKWFESVVNVKNLWYLG